MTNEEVTQEQLGGAKTHTSVSGEMFRFFCLAADFSNYFNSGVKSIFLHLIPLLHVQTLQVIAEFILRKNSLDV